MKIFLKTYGCQMNDRDSELVQGQFLNHGYTLTDDYQKADVILLNTCSVRKHAEERVFSELGYLGKKKRKLQAASQPAPIIGVIGCMAKNLSDEIIERIPEVDIVCGPNDLPKIYELVEQVRKEKNHIVEISSETRDRSFYTHLHHSDTKHSYVNISEGCSNFCSYCVVPYVRGAHRSRPVEDILKEIRALVKDGVSFVTLLGQNVNDYDSEVRSQKSEGRKVSFVDLVEMVSDIKGVKELGFVTSHPKDVDLRLFDVMAEHPNIKKYLHLPVQSGSNRILKLMNRKYTREKFLKIIKAYRKKIPDGIVATDVIVGFPTETDEDFQKTCNLLKDVEFDFAFLFKYSPRPHTKALAMKDDVAMETKKKRHQILLELQKEISAKKKAKKSCFVNR